MKKYVKKIFIAIMCLLIIYLAVMIYRTNFTKMYRMVYTVKDLYSPYMDLEGVHIEENEPNTIHIEFDMKVDCMYIVDELDAIYEKLLYVFLYDPNSPYQRYDLLVDFSCRWGEHMAILYRDHGQSVCLHMSISGRSSSLKIVERFPEITELYCFGSAYYDNVEELQGFDNLKILCLSQKMTEEDKGYIQSIYPDCYIDTRSEWK